MKRKKIQKFYCWFRILIQILAFILIPGVFTYVFSALGMIVTAVFKGQIDWETLKIPVWMLIATVPATVLTGRFFCGFFCSFGTVQDFLWYLSQKVFHMNFRIQGKTDRILKTAKYVILLFYISCVWSDILKLPFSGPWTVFGQYTSIGNWPGIQPVLSIGGCLLICIFISSFFVQRCFCRYLCPVGAVYSMVSKFHFLKIRKPGTECGSCHLCSTKCSMGINLNETDQVNTGACIQCQQCIACCPKENVQADKKYAVFIGVGITALTILISSIGMKMIIKMADPQNLSTVHTEIQTYQDGIYTGEGQGYRGSIGVTVEVENGEIVKIQLDDYLDDRQYMDRVEKQLLPAIIQMQSTEIDTVSGATCSSKGVLDAVKSALNQKDDESEQEQKEEFLESGRFRNLKDGVYTGSADAFRGDVEVQVTVENQKVKDIAIISYCDTEEYFFKAAPAVIEEIKTEQSLNVDAVSGATYSSNGIIQAVANALEIPEDQYEPRVGRNLKAKGKQHGHIVKHYISSQDEYEEKVNKYNTYE